MKYIFSLAFFMSYSLIAECPCRALSKKDRQELVDLLSDPMNRVQQSMDFLNNVIGNIQNIVVDITGVNDESKASCQQILKSMEHVKILLYEIANELIQQRLVLGNLDDVSVGEEEFNSVQDIDEADLSLVSWLKSIYREQLKDKFNS